MREEVLLLLVFLVKIDGCPKDCLCGLDVTGRQQVVCNQGGMHGPLPVHDIPLDTKVVKMSGREGRENSLILGPVLQSFYQLEEVHITSCNLPAIGKHTFWGVPTLKVLNLTDNNISQVQENNFRGLMNLEVLILDMNEVESMSSGTFHHLSELRLLSLRSNNLQVLAPRLFLKLGNLRVLDLSNNNLQHLNPEVFKDVQELVTFSCRSCNLRNMNPHIYSLLSNLAHLDLGDNQFKYLDKEEFKDLRKLETLYLDGNHFPVVLEGTFQSQNRLEYLNVGRSHIAKVTSHALDNLTCLQELDLSYNKLDRLEPITFQPLAHTLRALYLNGNNIRIEEFIQVLQVTRRLERLGLAEVDMRGGLPLGLLAPVGRLIHLNLSYNGLNRLSFQLLTPVTNLEMLDISGNNLNFLDERTTRRLESVATVYLGDNPWACDLCHILPMLKMASNSSWLKHGTCFLPFHLRGRTFDTLTTEELSLCGSGLDFKENGLTGLALTHRTQLGLIAAGSAVALLAITMAAVVAGLLYNRNHGSAYAAKSKPPTSESMCNVADKMSISTIDEMCKNSEILTLDGSPTS